MATPWRFTTPVVAVRIEAKGALGTEMMALGVRRPSLLTQISEGTEHIRKAQLRALEKKYGDFTFLDDVFHQTPWCY